MATCVRRLTLTTLLLLLLQTSIVLSKPRHHHNHGQCLLQQARGEVKQMRHYCDGQPEAHRVFPGIPLFSLCKRDFNAIRDFALDPQDTVKKCCRSPDHVKCSDEEWRVVLLARYIRVLCDLIHCQSTPPGS
ncbi:uncharacterized protein [Procambarus clarkii]|uniref:uncharacterized protein n=1 Tax=Procambarus clarkii TaxID=6728 RepID=UPI001E671B00|nr:uncharacterized protein LOC123770414 [Procambarus clarkii]